jgi:hypothetical protein
VPTEANLAGDLSDWPRQIYNPFSTRPDPAHLGQFLRDPFPDNIIPASLINPGMVTYAKGYKSYLTSFRSLPSDFISRVGFSQSFASNFIGNRTLVPALNVDNFFSGGESVNFVTPSDVYQARSTCRR